MIRSTVALLAVAAVLFTSVPPASAYGSQSMSLRVYSDGFVRVSQTLAVDPKAVSVQVPLVSAMVSGLVATDQNGSPLSYGFSPGGNITVYTLGATAVTIEYDTDNLTSKQGTVWTLAFTSKFNVTVVLPQFSTLGSVSGPPYSINETNMFPEIALSPGTWKVSYGVPLGATTSTSSGPGGTTTGGGIPGGSAFGFSALQVVEGGTAVGGVVIVLLLLRWWRGGGYGSIGSDLRPDDLRVLNFIQGKGGKVLEPEVRMNFALPKTSAWRQIKRLERLGYVRVTKIGSQNQIEIVKEKSYTP